MKKIFLLCFILIFALLFGCNSAEKPQDTGNVQMGNPWKDYAVLSEAESAAGISLGISETVAGYTACTFRVLNSELLEVTYKNGDSEVTVRKQAGEGNDISGDYTEYPTVTLTDMEGGSMEARTDGAVVSAIISFGGYSYSVYGPSETATAFTDAIFGA